MLQCHGVVADMDVTMVLVYGILDCSFSSFVPYLVYCKGVVGDMNVTMVLGHGILASSPSFSLSFLLICSC